MNTGEAVGRCDRIMKLAYKSQGKEAALIGGALDMNTAVYGFGVRLDQTEPQAHSALGPAAITAVKALEDMRQVVFGYARAGVFKIDLDFPVLSGG